MTYEDIYEFEMILGKRLFIQYMIKKIADKIEELAEQNRIDHKEQMTMLDRMICKGVK